MAELHFWSLITAQYSHTLSRIQTQAQAQRSSADTLTHAPVAK